MPGFDGTGPRGEGMFTGRGEGYCALRQQAPGSGGAPAVGYAGIQGRPVQLAASGEPLFTVADADVHVHLTNGLCRRGRWRRFGGRRCGSQRLAAL